MHNPLVKTAATSLCALLAWLLVRDRRRRGLPGRASIVSPRHCTRVDQDGSVHSVQSAHLELPRSRLEQLWSPAQLENLGRTYWRFLTRATLGIVRVLYGQRERSVVLIARPLTLLRFDTPRYVLEHDHASITWAIRDGLLVSHAGRGSGYLSIRVRRGTDPGEPASLDVDVEVANFYPSIASRLGTPVYRCTQAVVHVLVTHAFLRSLARLQLAQSQVGRLRDHR